MVTAMPVQGLKTTGGLRLPVPGPGPTYAVVRVIADGTRGARAAACWQARREPRRRKCRATFDSEVQPDATISTAKAHRLGRFSVKLLARRSVRIEPLGMHWHAPPMLTRLELVQAE